MSMSAILGQSIATILYIVNKDEFQSTEKGLEVLGTSKSLPGSASVFDLAFLGETYGLSSGGVRCTLWL